MRRTAHGELARPETHIRKDDPRTWGQVMRELVEQHRVGEGPPNHVQAQGRWWARRLLKHAGGVGTSEAKKLLIQHAGTIHALALVAGDACMAGKDIDPRLYTSLVSELRQVMSLIGLEPKALDITPTGRELAERAMTETQPTDTKG